MPDDIENLIRRLVCDDLTAAGEILDRAGSSGSPTLLVAAALLSDEPHTFLAGAAKNATTSRDRQLVEVAATHLAGQEDRLDALVREHLSDYPDNILAAWIASLHTRPANPAPSTARSTPCRSLPHP